MSDPTHHQSGWQLYRRLLQHSYQYKSALFVALVGMVFAAACDTGFAALVKPLMDEGFIAKNPDSALFYPPLMVGVLALRSLSVFVADFSVKWVGRRVTFDIRNQLFARIVDLPSSYYDSHSSSLLISKLIFDVEKLADAATDVIFVVVRHGLTIVGIFTLLTYLNWKLTAFFMIATPILVWLVRLMTDRLRRASGRIQQSMGDITKVTQEAVDGQRVVKTFNAQNQERAAFNKVNNENRQQAMKLATVAAAGTPLLEAVAAVFIGGIVYIALQQTAVGEFTVGAFISYLTALMILMPSARALSSINQTLQQGIAASHSAFSLLAELPEKDEGTVERDRVKGEIEYRNVIFAYADTDGPALSNVSFTVAPGRMLALVGASGSGKTTLASLLARFYLPQGGRILVDGIDIADYRLQNYRKHIAYVSQETILFDDSIRQNIAYGHSGEIDDARLEAAARAAHVLEFCERLPNGLDTMVGEKGLRLSGGQRQRIAIARAIYKDTPILILDEATSALDSESERHVQAAMDALTEHRTTLVIAHRLSTIERADQIIAMDEGRVAESGTHEQLLATGGIYAGLYKIQFQTSA